MKSTFEDTYMNTNSFTENFIEIALSIFALLKNEKRMYFYLILLHSWRLFH
jgi:hypothetical protein